MCKGFQVVKRGRRGWFSFGREGVFFEGGGGRRRSCSFDSEEGMKRGGKRRGPEAGEGGREGEKDWEEEEEEGMKTPVSELLRAAGALLPMPGPTAPPLSCWVSTTIQYNG